MDLNVKKALSYVNKPQIGLRQGANITALRQSHYVTNPNMQNKISAYDVTYGQSPVVDDYANAGELLKTPVLRHIAMA